MQRAILQLSDPDSKKILRGIATPVAPEEFGTQVFKDLIEDMKTTMRQAPGVGLAAPQIGISKQIVVIEDNADRQSAFQPEILQERRRYGVPFHVLVNPVLRLTGIQRVNFFEGCLSVKGSLRVTPRAERVIVEYQNEHGATRAIAAHGWYARILQHEIDHLNGCIYVDVGDARTEIPINPENLAKWTNATHSAISHFHQQCILQHEAKK